MEIETLSETVPQRYEEVLIRKMAHGLKRVDVSTVKETVADIKAQALGDTGKHTSTSRD